MKIIKVNINYNKNYTYMKVLPFLDNYTKTLDLLLIKNHDYLTLHLKYPIY